MLPILERELRQAMVAAGIDHLPLYPEERECRAPSAERVLEVFEPAFSHRARRGGLRRHVEGVPGDSRRKSMEALWARLRDPGSYRALQ
jgi:hypothetical protein